MAKKPGAEILLERFLFASRWLMAPFYVGLLVAVAALLVVFFQEIAHEIPHLWDPHHGMDADAAILLALSLIDLSLCGNLVLIVIFSGYENFVSKIDTASHEDRPEWMGTVDFSGLKLKLIASIVAISGIALLKAFLKLTEGTEPVDTQRIFWLVMVHLAFVVSGVMLALMDWLTELSHALAARHHPAPAATTDAH